MPYIIRNRKVRWSELSQEELIYVKETQMNSKTNIEARAKIALYINHYSVFKDIGDLMGDCMATAKDDDRKGELVEVLSSVLNRDKLLIEDHDNKGVVFTIDIETLRLWAMAATAWIDKDYSLISLPFEEMRIGKRRYKMPDALLINTTYQQYSNAQRYLQVYWQVVDAIRKEESKAMPLPLPAAEAMENVNGTAAVTDAGMVMGRINKEKISKLIKAADDAQAGFLANVLTPIVRTGETLYDDEGKPYENIRDVPRFVAEDEGLYKEDMKSAEPWLFSVVYQMVQNTLRQYGRKFPDLFSSDGEDEGKHKDSLVQELGTINLIIEKGGYQNAAAVYEENAVIIFKRLDMINEEARLTKQAMDRSRAKR